MKEKAPWQKVIDDMFIEKELMTVDLGLLREVFGERLREGVLLSRFTAARVGGPADGLLEATSSDELSEFVSKLWKMGVPLVILGGGSNVLISDRGYSGVVILNRARRFEVNDKSISPSVWVESGVNIGMLARQVALLGLAGLEWAVGIPGTVGGAVVGNAGAHDSDMAGNLLMAEILHQFDRESDEGFIREQWVVERLEYTYRNSLLKAEPGKAVVLSATLGLKKSSPEEVQARIEEFSTQRKRTQPPGASIGSMFKNPPGDYAGRLIEAAGLKGTRIGNAEISQLHANFFINHGQASAKDIFKLIQFAHQTVLKRFGVDLELEIELVGDFTDLG